MIEGYDIVCFAPNDWWGMNPSCTTHIIQRLARKNRILYVNPFSSDLGGGVKKGLSRRIARKLASFVKFLKKPQENLFVFSPVFFPLQGKRTVDALNNFLLKFQIKTLCFFLRMSKPLLWIENIRAADLIDVFRSEGIIYHVSDLFSEDQYSSNHEILREREQKVSRASDVQICVSRRLYEAKTAEYDNVFYLPHGVDFSRFRAAADNGEHVLKELEGIPRPIAGYFGTMTAHNDIELLEYCVSRLKDVSFVFAGQITGGDYEYLSRQPNVHLLGKLPYEKIPSLCAGFDVCLLQWKMSKWIEHCNPLKFFEYMASGKPIVSIPIREITLNYSDVVSIAATKEDYCDAIVWELNNDTPERACRRIEAARLHDWDSHVEQLSRLICGMRETTISDHSCNG